MPDPDPIERHLLDAVGSLEPGPTRRRGDEPVRPGSTLTGDECRRLFDAQLLSRQLDRAARVLRQRGQGFYTIGSSGHEGNAGVAAALRVDDPALLHYRSGAFYLTRGWRAAAAGPSHDPVLDVALGLAASSEEPIAGGRHKVFGHPDLAVLPTTSTIASHLPRAVGMAFAIDRAARLDLPTPWPYDAVVVASFGDASINHSTFAGAVNAAGWTAHQGIGLPLLLVCEDNGVGISVPSPDGWVRRALSSRPGVAYLPVDGCDLVATYDAAVAAVDQVRRTRRPVILHLDLVRLGGHAGADLETAYRRPGELAADLGRDPLLHSARTLVAAGLLDPDEVIARYRLAGEQVRLRAEHATRTPRLSDADQVAAPLAPRRAAIVAEVATRAGSEEARARAFDKRLPEQAGAITLAQSIGAALLDASLTHAGLVVFGEDVARKGGVYGVTKGLRDAIGSARVFDTLLDEQTVLGLGLGCGVAGLLPVPEIQYLAYLHNAADQLRGEAATMSWFSQGAYRNPLVVRIAGLGYQRGFGGHFHNDNAVAVLRDVPGIVLAAPARPDDAAPILRTCLAAAAADGSVCVFLEPIALYHQRDLHDSGDDGWLAPYEPPDGWTEAHVPIGSARTYGEGRDLAIVTFGNGVRMSLRVGQRLAARGLDVRVVDLRWLAPLPVADILAAAEATSAVLVVDETRRSGGVSEGVVTALVDAGFDGPVRRVTSEDCFIPLGEAAELVLLSEESIEAAARDLAKSQVPRRWPSTR